MTDNLDAERDKLRGAFVAGATAFQRIPVDLAERAFDNWLAAQVSAVDVLGFHDHPSHGHANVVALRPKAVQP
jgi:hypothetical protein